jgi:hypothetical protein
LIPQQFASPEVSALQTQATPAASSTNDPLSEITVPPGWYMNRIGPPEVIFTKQETLPEVPATGSLESALGNTERIELYAASLDGHSPQSWAYLNVGLPDGSMGLPPPSAWGTLSGYQTVHTVIANYSLYVIFASSTAYEFSLYPYPNLTDAPTLQNMMAQFATELSAD